MRTTIVVDDRLGEAARARARREGVSFSALVARALTEHLTKPRTSAKAPPFRLVTVGGGGPRPGIDLDKISELLTREDASLYSGEER